MAMDYAHAVRHFFDESGMTQAECVKRKAKKAVNPLYGKKGVGLAKDPAKSVKSAVYKKTTISAKDAAKKLTK